MEELREYFASARREESMLVQFANVDEYMRNYGRDWRDYYDGAGNRRDEVARRLLPLGWRLYRKDNLDELLAKCRETVNPAASLDELLDILEYVFNEYQAWGVDTPELELDDARVAMMLAKMNCQVLRMYSRKFALWLPRVFEYQQFRRNPNVHLRDGRNQPVRPVERTRRRDMMMPLPAGTVLRKSPSVVGAERRKAAWQVQHEAGFSARVARAFAEPVRESFLAARNRPAGMYVRPHASTAMLRP